jgi:hypothetical protein
VNDYLGIETGIPKITPVGDGEAEECMEEAGEAGALLDPMEEGIVTEGSKRENKRERERQ